MWRNFTNDKGTEWSKNELFFYILVLLGSWREGEKSVENGAFPTASSSSPPAAYEGDATHAMNFERKREKNGEGKDIWQIIYTHAFYRALSSVIISLKSI